MASLNSWDIAGAIAWAAAIVQAMGCTTAVVVSSTWMRHGQRAATEDVAPTRARRDPGVVATWPARWMSRSLPGPTTSTSSDAPVPVWAAYRSSLQLGRVEAGGVHPLPSRGGPPGCRARR